MLLPLEGSPWPWGPSAGCISRPQAREEKACSPGKGPAPQLLDEELAAVLHGFHFRRLPGAMFMPGSLLLHCGGNRRQIVTCNPSPPHACRDPARRAANMNAARLRPLRGHPLGQCRLMVTLMCHRPLRGCPLCECSLVVTLVCYRPLRAHLLGECGLVVTLLHSLPRAVERHCVIAPAWGHLLHSCCPQAMSGEG